MSFVLAIGAWAWLGWLIRRGCLRLDREDARMVRLARLGDRDWRRDERFWQTSVEPASPRLRSLLPSEPVWVASCLEEIQATRFYQADDWSGDG